MFSYKYIKKIFLLFFCFIFLFISCFTKIKKGEKRLKRTILELALGENIPVTIFSVTPKIGSPRQKINGQVFNATRVTIRGTGFTVKTKVYFGDIEADISKRTSKLLLVDVPKGATTGKIKVFNSEKCKEDNNEVISGSCKVTRFYIDCYSVLNSLYGEEQSIKSNFVNEIEYEISKVKAFRSVFSQSNELTDNKSINFKIKINCDTFSNVRMHGPSCEPRESNKKLEHEFKITTFYSPQYYVAAGQGKCRISNF